MKIFAPLVLLAFSACSAGSDLAGTSASTAAKASGSGTASADKGDVGIGNASTSASTSASGSGPAAETPDANPSALATQDGVTPDEADVEVVSSDSLNDPSAAVDTSCADPATVAEVKGGLLGRKSKSGKLTAIYPDKGAPLPKTAPDDCRDGVELNRLTRHSVLLAATGGGAKKIRLEVDVATYLAPDHVRMFAVAADGAKKVILDTCRMQTAKYGDPTKASPQRPPEDSIREFRTDLPAGTKFLQLDFTDATSPTYIRVVGLCDFDRKGLVSDAKGFAVGLLDKSGGSEGVVKAQLGSIP